MDQHICLFYLADKLPVPKLQEFYHRMCSALGYTERKYDSYYLLYDTQYHVFQDTPLTDSRKKALGKIAHCANCHAICKKNIYKPFQIEDNACIICKLSPLYRNGRIRSESNVLRRFLEPNAPFSDVFLNPSMSFMSCVRLGHDYAIGTFPVIQLHAFLYSYLKSTNGYGELTRDKFLDGFVLFLLSKVTSSSSADSHMDASEFRELVAFHMGRLYGIDPRSVTSDLWENEVATLRKMYTYVAPSPSYKGTSVSLSSHKKEAPPEPAIRPGKQFSLFDMVLPSNDASAGHKEDNPTSDMYDSSTYSAGDVSEKPANNNASAGSSPQIEQESSLAPDQEDGTPVEGVFSAENDVFDPYEPSQIPEDALYDEEMDAGGFADYYPDEDIPEEAFAAYEGYIPEEILYDDTRNEIPVVPEAEMAPSHEQPSDSAVKDNCNSDTQEQGVACVREDVREELLLPSVMSSVLDACVTVSDLMFENAVQPLTSEKCFSFSEHVLRSSFVCVEPAICFNRYGLLIFVPDNMRTYFFDLELYGTDILESLFMEDSLTVYTMHALAVIDLFSRRCSSFHNFCPLDLIVASTKDAGSHQGVFSALGWETGAFYNYMPSYPSVYAQALEKFSERNGFDKNIRRIMVLYQVLAKNDNLRFLNERLECNLIVEDMHAVRFKYRYGMEIHQKGLMYIFALPKDSIACTLDGDNLFSDVLMILNLLPHLHRNKVYLLSAESDRLTFFYLGDKEGGSQFYDLFLANLQSAYIKRNGHPLLSNSYCYLFDKKL